MRRQKEGARRWVYRNLFERILHGRVSPLRTGKLRIVWISHHHFYAIWRFLQPLAIILLPPRGWGTSCCRPCSFIRFKWIGSAIFSYAPWRGPHCRGVTIPLFTGSTTQFWIAKRLKIRHSKTVLNSRNLSYSKCTQNHSNQESEHL